MAFSLTITAVRASSVQVQPSGPGGGYTLLVSYALCSGARNAWTDVLVGRGERELRQDLAPGHPMPAPAELAAMIRQDCQIAFGGQPDVVLLAGNTY